MALARWFRHLCSDLTTVRRAFTPEVMAAIEEAVAREEQRHDGELRVAIEAGLPFADLWRNTSARERALEIFARLRVWDTEQNTGVLIYLLLAEKRVELIADRGIHRKVGTAAWETICGNMQREFAGGRFREGVLLGIEAVSDLLATHFPPLEDNENELPNKPIVI
jgi:uncharacterized membrane protein